MSYKPSFTNASITVSVWNKIFGLKSFSVELDITYYNYDVYAEIEGFLEQLNDEYDLELEVSDTNVINYKNVPKILQSKNSENGFLDDEFGDYIEALQNDPNNEDMLITALENGLSISEALAKYIGYYDDNNIESFGEKMAENNLYLSDMPKNLRGYFDFKSYGEDCLNDYNNFDGYVFTC